VQDVYITDGNAIPDEVVVDLDMLYTLVLNRVGGEVDDTGVVTIDETALRQRSVEHLEELLEPTSLGHAIGHGAILSLSARAGDDVLTLGGPGDLATTRCRYQVMMMTMMSSHAGDGAAKVTWL
jgi:hypothetical protein